MLVSVTGKENVVSAKDSRYLVFTDSETFQVDDSFLFWRFNSSDIYGQIREGQEYSCRVAGWRVPFLSMYRNILELRELE
jgi:hypothetical protein